MTAAVPDFDFHPPAPPPQPAWQALPLRFTGSGSEYFRIWIVNLLLVVVTLSLYLPYARARRLRYFHGNTLLGGQALGFHGNGHAMLRGHLLILAFAGAYALAGRFSPLAAGLAGLALALLWPALWQASLRFRLANTSWRGLRFRFTGSLGDAYRCLWPALVPAGPFLLLTGLRGHDGAQTPGIGLWADAGAGLCMLALVASAPWLFARLKRYQHGHYHYAGDTTTLAASGGDFYRLWLRASGLALLVLLALGMLMGGLVVGVPRLDSYSGEGGGFLLLALLLGGLYLMTMAGLQAWGVARLQNLVWSRTSAPRVRFASNLEVLPLARLGVKNLLLTVLTLGLYRPFAVVATTRMRLQAVSVETLGPVDSWVADTVGSAGDAAGDAAGDLLGVDLGL